MPRLTANVGSGRPSVEALEPNGGAPSRGHFNLQAVVSGHCPVLNRDGLWVGAVIRPGSIAINLCLVVLVSRQKAERLGQRARILVRQRSQEPILPASLQTRDDNELADITLECLRNF